MLHEMGVGGVGRVCEGSCWNCQKKTHAAGRGRALPKKTWNSLAPEKQFNKPKAPLDTPPTLPLFSYNKEKRMIKEKPLNYRSLSEKTFNTDWEKI